MLRAQMLAGLHPTARWELDTGRLEELAGCLRTGRTQGAAIRGLYLGTPGAYRKLTATLANRGGTVVAVARIPLDTLSGEAVRNEVVALKGLEAVSALDGRTPRVMDLVTWEGRAISFLSVGAGGRSSRRLETSHLRFLEALHAGTAAEAKLQETALWKRLQIEMPALRSRLPAPWPELLDRALRRLAESFGDRSFPASTAHRDFAPWNCRTTEKGLFVFDWEMASEQSTPLLDAIHFHAVQAALRGRPLRLPGSLEEHLVTVWPEGRQALSSLVLAYLTDIGFHYAKARALRPETGSDQLLDWFRFQLDELLAAGPPA